MSSNKKLDMALDKLIDMLNEEQNKQLNVYFELVMEDLFGK